MNNQNNCDILDSVGMLSVPDRVSQLRINHVFNIYHGRAPEYLCENFNNNTELKLLRVFFLDLGSRHFAFLYKNLSLPFTLLTIFETIISKFKYLSICTP
jgi:hypothetical protein